MFEVGKNIIFYFCHLYPFSLFLYFLLTKIREKIYFIIAFLSGNFFTDFVYSIVDYYNLFAFFDSELC